ncbi:5-formyltetrahydrofolate cyclo-ligase [Dokdonella koreensis]|uniref:5-formyltetrahydrofolate cyclo-ligase n=1 Tax=Dokdonella koreensis DS-123 TaxID=1300342 RepID=A0A160DRY2_9GAMM|nr:5-formyltetrahydrofolate cyclo-ligase [Dokdonella koreensis]ANB16998.1 5,10-methenyltetrahydrofolate synthetase [Dokdonella koreensis DS-123]
MNAPDDRQALRAQLRARRRAVAARERIAAAEAVGRSLGELADFLTDTRVGGYWAVDGELSLHAILPGLRERGQRYHLPVVHADRRLRFAEWTAGTAVVPNRYGIPEPQAGEADLLAPHKLDLVLVPLLGFDRAGNRLGYGGGWYDRSFAWLRERDEPGDTLLVGVAHSAQELERIEPQPWDVRLDYVATERELIDCWPEKAP